jgi:GT2 family glycosyltransferase
MDPQISIIVPSRRRPERLNRLLDRLGRQIGVDDHAFEVVVGLDDDDGAVRGLTARRDPFATRFIPLPAVGISAAKNAAIADARGEILLLLNDDVEPQPGFLAAHLRAQSAGHEVVLGASPFTRRPDANVFDALVAGTRMIFFYSDLIDGGRYDFRHAWNLNLGVHRALLADLDPPFEEELRPVFFDDIEFAFRLIGRERRVYYATDAHAPHDHRYGFADYFEREALLGVMSTVLANLNPGCHQAIFQASPAEIRDRAEQELETDVRDRRRMLAEFARACAQPAGGGGEPSEDKLAALYTLHLPLKRRAFRIGVVAAGTQPHTPWPERMRLATDALRRDAVFSHHPEWSVPARRKSRATVRV